jgi:hypothetical protein
MRRSPITRRERGQTGFPHAAQTSYERMVARNSDARWKIWV